MSNGMRINPYTSSEKIDDRLLHNVIRYVNDFSVENDISMLDGITISSDFKNALNQVSKGYGCSSEVNYTNDDIAICAAKGLTFKSNDEYVKHIVFDLRYLLPLTDIGSVNARTAKQLLLHEVSHAVEFGWRRRFLENGFQGHMYNNIIDSIFLGTALVSWEEYAACRLSSLYGDCELLIENNKSLVSDYFLLVHDAVFKAKMNFVSHRSVDTFLNECSHVICEPFRHFGYILGHIDSFNKNVSLKDVLYSIVPSTYINTFNSCEVFFRRTWDSKNNWEGSNIRSVFEPMTKVIESVFNSYNIYFTPQSNGMYYVKVL